MAIRTLGRDLSKIGPKPISKSKLNNLPISNNRDLHCKTTTNNNKFVDGSLLDEETTIINKDDKVV